MASTVLNGYGGTPKRSIEVPIRTEGEVLEVLCDDLPDNTPELTDIFLKENVGILHYRTLAMEYYRQNRIEQSITTAQAGLAAASQSASTRPQQKLPLLTLVATLHMRQARLAKKDSAERKQRLEAATQYINQADHILTSHNPTFVLKGNLYSLKENYDEAARSFDMALEKKPGCIPALLGRAKIHYKNRQFKAALKMYQTALKYHSRSKYCGIEIRLGIAQCFAHLKMYPEAKIALQRCIDMARAPNSTALIMLAIIELNDSKKVDGGILQQENNLKSGLQHMKEAHSANKKHPAVLNMMANHFFLTRDFEMTMASASRALETASNTITKAEASYQIARAHHQMQEYDLAYQFYAQALKLNKDHILGQFGMGQMQLKRGENNTAIEIFEKLHKSEPECVEIMKVLGSLYGLVGKKEKSLALFDKLLEHTDDDPLLAMEIAEIYEEKNNATSLKYYEQSLALLEDIPTDDQVAMERVKEIKPELLNNIAVMHQTLGNSVDAEHYYGLAITESEQSNDDDQKLKLTMSYNLARLYEDRFEIEKARAIYRKIIEDYPGYTDAHLRMGAIEMSLGKSEEAIECYKEVFDTDPLDAKAWIMIGQAQAATSEKLTKRSYEKVLRDCDKNDLYTHVALGNYHAAAAREFKTDKQKELRKNSYQLAVNFYSQALRRDPNNVYAANGLAITIAENGHVEQARDLFTQVREAAVSNSSVWANLAHVYVELKQYKQAIVMYENASKKFFNNKDANLLLCLARTQYILSKSDKDPRVMYQALKNTEKALHITPSDKTTHYNLALVQQSYAQQISDLTTEQRTSSSMRRAISCLECSQRTFRMLISVSDHTLYDKKIAEQRERYGETLRTQLSRMMTEQIKYEEDKERDLNIARRNREAERAKLREAEEEKKRQQELENQKMEEVRRQLMEKVREDNLLMASQQAEDDEFDEEKKAAKKQRGRKRRDRDDEEGEGGEDPEDEYERALKRKDKKQYKSKRIIEDSDEDSDEEML